MKAEEYPTSLPINPLGSARFLLPDPGFVPNTPEQIHCFQATLLMALRSRPYEEVPSLADLDKHIGSTPGKYSWPYAGLAYMARRGFKVLLWEAFDPAALLARGEDYILEFYGESAGRDSIAKSDMPALLKAARECLDSATFTRKHEIPRFEDIKNLLRDGYYLNLGVNQKILQGDSGYVGHGIFVFGYTENSIIAHNPGPPSTVASEIPWYLLEKAWSSPNEQARMLYAFRP